MNRSRHCNEQQAIIYTKKIYNIDLSLILSNQKYYWDYKINYYNEFYKTHSYPIEDDGSRKFFNIYGRKSYEKFMDLAYFDNEDCIMQHMKYSDIHHIHPLCFGGKNNIENLIHINNFNHDVLHENPLEEHEVYCHQAVDFLGCLYSEVMTGEIIRKYKLVNYSEDMFVDMYKACIKEEMRNYYNYKQEEFNSNKTSCLIHN